MSLQMENLPGIFKSKSLLEQNSIVNEYKWLSVDGIQILFDIWNELWNNKLVQFFFLLIQVFI
jgi:hypothetical protein